MVIFRVSKWSTTIIVLIALLQVACVTQPKQEQVLVYGASGRIGAAIVDEALLRGYAVTGVTRDRSRLQHLASKITVEEGDILDRDATKELVSGFDTVIVSIGGPPRTKDPSQYIAATSAEALIDVLTQIGPTSPRLIYVGNVFTLKYENDKTLLELDRVPESHKNYAMFYGHQIALDAFRQTEGIRWTVASPPNGLRLKGRTGEILWADDTVIRDADGSPAAISLEDYAFSIFEELRDKKYIGARYTVARKVQ